jgi:hypothetical protein
VAVIDPSLPVNLTPPMAAMSREQPFRSTCWLAGVGQLQPVALFLHCGHSMA